VEYCSGDKIGIPECDDYLAKYDSCAPKVLKPDAQPIIGGDQLAGFVEEAGADQ